jgi:hypothetical protein
MWLELTSETDEKIYVNVSQLIVIYPVDEHKLTRILTSGGPSQSRSRWHFSSQNLKEGAANNNPTCWWLPAIEATECL